MWKNNCEHSVTASFYTFFSRRSPAPYDERESRQNQKVWRTSKTPEGRSATFGVQGLGLRGAQNLFLPQLLHDVL